MLTHITPSTVTHFYKTGVLLTNIYNTPVNVHIFTKLGYFLLTYIAPVTVTHFYKTGILLTNIYYPLYCYTFLQNWGTSYKHILPLSMLHIFTKLGYFLLTYIAPVTVTHFYKTGILLTNIYYPLYCYTFLQNWGTSYKL